MRILVRVLLMPNAFTEAVLSRVNWPVNEDKPVIYQLFMQFNAFPGTTMVPIFTEMNFLFLIRFLYIFCRVYTILVKLLRHHGISSRGKSPSKCYKTYFHIIEPVT